MNQTVITKKLDQKQLNVTREFNGPIDLVWRAWTEPALLDQWWAPKPWKTVTKSMDFREGGRWLYSMNGPDGEQHWCLGVYGKITYQQNFQAQDAFCDEEGNIDSSTVPSMHWNVTFRETGSRTKVLVTISLPSEEAMETIIEMGFKEGFTAAHGNLDELLKELVAESDLNFLQTFPLRTLEDPGEI